MTSSTTIPAVIFQGHRVASGLNGNPKFPGGTLLMQTPHFLQRGLDLSKFHRGTINIRIAPYRYQVLHPTVTFRSVQWHPTEPAEDFSFFDVQVIHRNESYHGLIYYPHPETKPEHFQPPDALELLLPFIPDLSYGQTVEIRTSPDQMIFLPSTA